jgi:hypothetical protein
MSGAVRAALPADTVVGAPRETHVQVLAMATSGRALPDLSPRTTTTAACAHLSLVMPTHPVGLVSGSSGTVEAGVC